jgi:hypothetical protein
MPYTARQAKLFRAVSHGWRPPASSGINLDQHTAEKLATEAAATPVRPPVGKAAKVGAVLRRMR